MTPVLFVLAVILAVSIAAPPAYAHSAVSIDTYSQGVPGGGARAGASITATSSAPGREGSMAPATVSGGGEGPAGGSSESSAPPRPSNGETGCVARGEVNVSPCYGVVPAPAPAAPAPAAAPGPVRPPVNPAAMAVSASTRLDLTVGGVVASPSARTAGLTGAASWFWIEPSPAARSLSVALRGERVTVSAAPGSVRWSFGDGSQLVAGSGVPYRPGAAPHGAVLHAYQTRCLPGDRGHDPNVLASCGPDGYTVEALVQWAISYTAAGPVAGGGTLPSRSTATSIVYPVSEARAFLTAGGER